MANKFTIRKKLVVSGPDLQPLVVQGRSGQLLNVASSSQGNIFSANDPSGIPLLKVSASNFIIGPAITSKGYAVVSIGDSIVVTGSAFLTSVKVPQSLPQGSSPIVLGNYSHAQGDRTTAKGNYSHAEGLISIASGSYSHTEGYFTTASGLASHAEGRGTLASGSYSHAQGSGSIAIGIGSHAEGRRTSARGNYSHTQGTASVALGDYQHVTGQFNISSSIQSTFIHGNGTSNTARRNLIYTSEPGAPGVVTISGSLKLSQGSIGRTFTPITVRQVTATTISAADTGLKLLFKNPSPNNRSTDLCNVTFPSNLPLNFTITLTTTDQVLYIITGSGVTFINNAGNGLGMKSSVTLINTGTTNEYLSLGDL